jgi:hypothetical protein
MFLSYIDKPNYTDYTAVTGEVVGALGSTTYSGTLSAITGKRTAFLVVIAEAGGETLIDNADGHPKREPGIIRNDQLCHRCLFRNIQPYHDRRGDRGLSLGGFNISRRHGLHLLISEDGRSRRGAVAIGIREFDADLSIFKP